MRTIGGALCALLFLGGCAPVALKDSTVAVGNTLTDLHYRMVLDNLAMFRTDYDSLPWHLKITTGLVQINDTVGVAYTVSQPLVRTLTLAPSQGWTESWTVVPEIDETKLRYLRHLYRSAATAKDFDTHFEQGARPGGAPYGNYGSTFVWVKPGRLDALTELTLKVLGGGAVKEGERPVLVPGPQLQPR